MNVYEIMQSSGAVVNCFRKNEQEIATELLRNLVAKAFEEGRKEGGAEEVKKIPAVSAKIEEEYNRSWWAWEKLERVTFDSDYEEDFEDTIIRKYEEGYSDALAMVKRLLEEVGE